MTKRRGIKWLLSAPNEANIADQLTSDELGALGQTVVRMYDLDCQNRKEWDDLSASALKLAKQVREAKSTPWEGCANVKYPLITSASIQFAARAYPEICKGNRVVKCQITGDDPEISLATSGVPAQQQITGPGPAPGVVQIPGAGPGMAQAAGPGNPTAVPTPQGTVQSLPKSEKQKRADRISDHMNFQLTQEMEEWEADMDCLLHVLPVIGQCYKKAYFSPSLRHNISELILPDCCVVSKSRHRDIKKARRITHRLWIYENEAIEKMSSGLWREIELGRPVDAGVDEDAPHEFLEQHCYIDLDEDRYKEPYIVTVHRHTAQVVRVTARWQMENVEVDPSSGKLARIIPDHYFIHFGFIPNADGSINSMGFGQLLEPINASLNTAINQLLDSGSLANAGGGFIGRGARLRGGSFLFRLGEWKPVDVPGGTLKENLVPLPVREPSAVLFQLLGFLVQAGREVSSVHEILTGDAKLAATMPVGTMMALVEQGLKVFTAIYKRLYRSLSEEFKRHYHLNARYLEPRVTFFVSGHPEQFEVGLQDYRADDTLVMPVADPDLSSDMQRLLKAQALKDLRGSPGLNEVEVTRELVRAVRPVNTNKLLLTDAQMSGDEPTPWQPPPNPQMVLAQAKAEHLKARAQEAILRLQMDLQKFGLEMESLVADIGKKKAETMLAIAKAEAEEAGSQLSVYKAEMENIARQVEAQAGLLKQKVSMMVGGQAGPQSAIEGRRQPVIEGRLRGGPVTPDQPFVVGEGGPEVFVPSLEAGSNNKDLAKVMSILVKNRDKQFVSRILNPVGSPILDLGDGSFATHLMGWGEHPQGGYMVYPHVIDEGGTLKELSPDDAYKNAIMSNELIKFRSEEEADWFSKNYKKVWGPFE